MLSYSIIQRLVEVESEDGGNRLLAGSKAVEALTRTGAGFACRRCVRGGGGGPPIQRGILSGQGDFRVPPNRGLT